MSICAECASPFKIGTRSGKALFCSRACAKSNVGKRTMAKNRRIKPATRATIKCPSCTKLFTAWPSANRVYCSIQCAASDPSLKTQRVKTFKDNGSAVNTYSRCPKGWIEIGGKRIFCKSSWEAKYARYLEWLKSTLVIADWEYEPKTFWFDKIKRGVRSYLPDFRVAYPDGREEWHEVKGWMDTKSKTKLKRMAKYHPSVTLEVRDGKWFKGIDRMASGLVPLWKTPFLLASPHDFGPSFASPIGWGKQAFAEAVKEAKSQTSLVRFGNGVFKRDKKGALHHIRKATPDDLGIPELTK